MRLGLSVRRATPADAEALARLRYEFRSSLAPVTEDAAAFISRCAAWMRQRLHEPGRWHCWLAQSGPEAVGNLWLETIEKIPNPVQEAEWHAYITNIYVRESHRNGTGERLLISALGWCREHDVDCVILWARPRSRTLYERQGFQVPDAVLTLKVAAGGVPS